MRGCLRKLGIILGVIVVAIAVIGIVFWLNWKRGRDLTEQAWRAYYDGKPTEALAFYQELLTISGLTERQEDDAHNRVDELEAYLNASSMYENDRLDQAIDAYQTFMEEYCPEHRIDNLYCSNARKNLAIAIPGHAQELHRNGEYTEAVRIYLSALNLETLGDAECPPIGVDDGRACHEAETAIEQCHSKTLTAIPTVMMDWASALQELSDYQEFEEMCEIVLEDYPNILDEYQSKVSMAQFYSDWAGLLRQDESYAAAIEKYEIVLNSYAATPSGGLAQSAIEETRAEYIAWLEANPAIPLVEYPEEISRDSEGRWSWTTVFKETGGKVGYTVIGSGWIEDTEGDQYGPLGSSLDRGPVEVPPGGEGEDSYWVRGDTFADGYAVITWEGEDEGGHQITIEMRIHLLP